MTINYPRFTFSGEKVFELPKRFWSDHEERALLCSDICPDQEAHSDARNERVIEGPKHYRVTLTAIDATELGSDANHYTDVMWWSDNPENLGLQVSARATLKRLEGYARNPGMTKETK